MQLQRLLRRMPTEVAVDLSGDASVDISSLEYDSRRVSPGALFAALPGSIVDGNAFVPQALSSGASAVLSQHASSSQAPAAWLRCAQPRRALAALADVYYERPSQSLDLIGVTGTNGKTTTAYLLHSILSQEGPSLMMGTIGTVLGKRRLDSALTTPQSTDVQRTLADALKSGCRTGVMEVSSHALDQYRVAFCRFPVAVFTNLSQDHLDYHGSFQDYFQAKRRLFSSDNNSAVEKAVINGDDPWSAQLVFEEGVQVIRFGLSLDCQVRPLSHRSSVEGTRLELQFHRRRLSLRSRLAGMHNVFNIMAAAAAASALGVGDQAIRKGIEDLAHVPGRFERVETKHPAAIFVDYAHSPHALENILQLCRSLRARRLICVFGCGGDRDREKRPLMGRIAVDLSDLAIVTSDNPRHESPESIVEEILSGIPSKRDNFEVVVDRRRAIGQALETAEAGDIVLIAGKGHETYQEIAGRRIDFDDRQVVGEWVSR